MYFLERLLQVVRVNMKVLRWREQNHSSPLERCVRQPRPRRVFGQTGLLLQMTFSSNVISGMKILRGIVRFVRGVNVITRRNISRRETLVTMKRNFTTYVGLTENRLNSDLCPRVNLLLGERNVGGWGRSRKVIEVLFFHFSCNSLYVWG